MAAGEGTLEEFLSAQVAFTRRLVAKALDAKIERGGEHPCPRCQNGVLVKRSGKNGDFWGCSNYPRCRMSCDDKEGKPDFDARAARAASARPAPSGASSRAGQKDVRPARGFGASALSDEEMAAFLAEYAPLPSAQEMMNSSLHSKRQQEKQKRL